MEIVYKRLIRHSLAIADLPILNSSHHVLGSTLTEVYLFPLGSYKVNQRVHLKILSFDELPRSAARYDERGIQAMRLQPPARLPSTATTFTFTSARLHERLKLRAQRCSSLLPKSFNQDAIHVLLISSLLWIHYPQSLTSLR